MAHELSENELVMLDALTYYSQLSDGYDITDDAYQLLCISKNVSGRTVRLFIVPQCSANGRSLYVEFHFRASYLIGKARGIV